MYCDRIVVPPKLRGPILETLHSAHQGTTSMTSRAQASVFWPGITAQLQHICRDCTPCEEIAPSQPNPPPTPIVDPVYPFQQVCSDYFKYIGHNYLLVVDRYSGWPTVYQLKGGSGSLIKKLREIFVTFGIPEEVASDGGPEFSANETTQFLRDWGVKWRLSSVAYPHSNSRAELGVKTVKRMIMNNTDSTGNIDIPKFQRAMLQYRNTPSSIDKRSPAEIVFGRQIRDFIPVKLGNYIPCFTWVGTMHDREAAFRQRHAKEVEILSEHTKVIPQLKVGDHVRIQNQTGNTPRRWDRTGVVVEVRQYDQYAVKVHGSGRVTLRNRKFLRKYIPFSPSTLMHVPVPPSISSRVPVAPMISDTQSNQVATDGTNILHTSQEPPRTTPPAEETTPESLLQLSTTPPEALLTSSSAPLPPSSPQVPSPSSESVTPPRPLRPQRKREPPKYLADFEVKLK